MSSGRLIKNTNERSSIIELQCSFLFKPVNNYHNLLNNNNVNGIVVFKMKISTKKYQLFNGVSADYEK
ncbi:MAG: hypothetical protein CVV23_09210 [Ignavibacteriae bacterium HGW-Ignavibacteriae-2]|nr:MAG: hypothetical protein CVV23_09210 [Ignavibacteriae bacterium HGW-Ignavibacteriae-2]